MTTKKLVKDMSIQEIDECLDFGEKLKKRLEPDFEKINEINEPLRTGRELDNPTNSSFSIINKNVSLISDLESKKEEIIKQAISQMYKGVLVDQEITIRSNDIYYYKSHRNNIGLSSLKEKILKNLFEVREKVGDTNIDVLEFILQYIEEKKEKGYSNDNNEDLNFVLPKSICLAKLEGSSNLSFEVVRRIKFKPNSEIEFHHEESEMYQENERSYRSYSSGVYLTDRQQTLILKKYEKEINEFLKEKINSQEVEINRIKQEISEIKEKAGTLLVIAQLKKDNKTFAMEKA